MNTLSYCLSWRSDNLLSLGFDPRLSVRPSVCRTLSITLVYQQNLRFQTWQVALKVNVNVCVL